MNFRCAHCRAVVDKPTGHVRRSRAKGAPLYCGRRCFGLARRQHKTKAQKVSKKRLYDLSYRMKNRALLKAKKAEYFKRTYDPKQAAVLRKKNMSRHVEYCRRPKYRRWKSSYDKKYRAKRDYGMFAAAAMLVSDINVEINQRIQRHEVRYQNQGTNKAQRRRREDAKEPERGRNSRRSSPTSFS